jgi:hypothetical protein
VTVHHFAGLRGPTDNTVAIIGLAVAGIVGLVGPVIAGLFERSRQRTALNHAAELDAITEQRRVIYEALEMLVRLDRMRFTPENVINQSVQELANTSVFATHRLKLLALFGPGANVASSYDAAVFASIMRAVTDVTSPGDAGKTKRQEAQLDANAKKDDFVTMVKPYLVAEH